MDFSDLTIHQLSAVCKHLDIDSETLENRLSDGKYRLLTDSEADDMAYAYIKESLWAFNADFLAGETGIDKEVFSAIQANNRCESNNEAVFRLIPDFDAFVEAAIAADGRGHFLSPYDGEETEISVPGGEHLYLYRVD